MKRESIYYNDRLIYAQTFHSVCFCCRFDANVIMSGNLKFKINEKVAKLA